MVMVLMVGGIQLLALGAIGEYMGRYFSRSTSARNLWWPPGSISAIRLRVPIFAGVKSDGKNR